MMGAELSSEMSGKFSQICSIVSKRIVTNVRASRPMLTVEYWRNFITTIYSSRKGGYIEICA
jgi:hypothetical protein